jgi:hypothetical protein
MVMSQAEIAKTLGLSPASMTKMKRAGCPMGTVEEVRAWRARNIGPYIKPGATSYAPPPRPYAPPAPARPAHRRPLAELLQAQPLSDPADVLEAAFSQYFLLPMSTAPTLLIVLRDAALAQVAAGQAYLGEDMLLLLMNTLQALPESERMLPATVLDALKGPG